MENIALLDTPWLQTINPTKALRWFDLVNPAAAMVYFPTMALVLSRIPRFNAHTERGVYSVAQHSVEGAYAIERDTGNKRAAAAFLLHDGHEYVMGDRATPVVKALAIHAEEITGNIYAGEVIGRAENAMKAAIDRAIYAAAGIDWPLTRSDRTIVKEYDERMGCAERNARLDESPIPWTDRYAHVEPVTGCDLTPWGAHVAEGRFLQALKYFRIIQK